MTPDDRHQTPADLAWVAERLEHERPRATPLELDRMKVQARAQAFRGARSREKGSFLKSRVAITAILMLGLMTGGTGTTLALSGSSEQGNASQAQYPRQGGSGTLGGSQANPRQGGGGVLGESQESPRPRGQVLGQTESSPAAVQGSGQVAATQGGSSLPFTGLAATPLILLGLALLGTGAMLYRSSRRPPSEA